MAGFKARGNSGEIRQPEEAKNVEVKVLNWMHVMKKSWRQ